MIYSRHCRDEVGVPGMLSRKTSRSALYIMVGEHFIVTVLVRFLSAADDDGRLLLTRHDANRIVADKRRPAMLITESMKTHYSHCRNTRIRSAQA